MDDDDDIEPAGRRRLALSGSWSVEGEVRGEGQGGEERERVYIGTAWEWRGLPLASFGLRQLGGRRACSRVSWLWLLEPNGSKWVGAGGGSKCARLVAVNVTQRTGRAGGRPPFLLTGAIGYGSAASGTESDREL